MPKHEGDTIHEVVAFHVCITRLLFYLDNQGEEDKRGGDERKGTADVGELLHNLDSGLHKRVCSMVTHSWSATTPA